MDRLLFPGQVKVFGVDGSKTKFSDEQKVKSQMVILNFIMKFMTEHRALWLETLPQILPTLGGLIGG